jgi:hypothetical protein
MAVDVCDFVADQNLRQLWGGKPERKETAPNTAGMPRKVIDGESFEENLLPEEPIATTRDNHRIVTEPEEFASEL